MFKNKFNKIINILSVILIILYSLWIIIVSALDHNSFYSSDFFIYAGFLILLTFWLVLYGLAVFVLSKGILRYLTEKNVKRLLFSITSTICLIITAVMYQCAVFFSMLDILIVPAIIFIAISIVAYVLSVSKSKLIC